MSATDSDDQVFAKEAGTCGRRGTELREAGRRPAGRRAAWQRRTRGDGRVRTGRGPGGLRRLRR